VVATVQHDNMPAVGASVQGSAEAAAAGPGTADLARGRALEEHRGCVRFYTKTPEITCHNMHAV
jgi:hypothetical protein